MSGELLLYVIYELRCISGQRAKGVQVVEESKFETLEALAAQISTVLLYDFDIPEITVAVEKPSALAFVEASGVEITRGRPGRDSFGGQDI